MCFSHMSVFPVQNSQSSVIYDAGHEIVSENCDRVKLLDHNCSIQPSYQPIVAFEVFRQIIQMKGLHNITERYPTPGPGTCPDYPAHSA